MNPADKGRLTREALKKSLDDYVSIQAKIGMGSRSVGDVDSYFQQTPLSRQFFDNLYGDEEKFYAKYQGFVDQYFAALDDSSKHAKGASVNIELMKKRSVIDLGVFDRETSDRLYKMFVDDVLQLDALVGQGGLPGVEMPSANLYGKSFRYMTQPDASGAMHPAQVLLNRSFFNFNPRMQGLDSFKVSRRNLLSSRALREVTEQTKPGKDIFGGLREGMKVITLDVETTGVFDFSNVRSFSAVESTFSGGKLSAPVAVANELFDSPQLNGMTVGTLNGSTHSMNKFLAASEGGGRGSKSMSTFLDEGADFIERILDADRIAGHNVNFDLDKIIQTMQEMDGFENHTRAKEALKKLVNRVDEGDFLMDTLESTRIYLNNQVNELVELSKATDISDKSKSYVDNLFSQEILARVHTGGSAAPFSMENIALNTNLFELIENEGKAGELFDLITRGSHVAETDVHLQAYMANYVQSGQLKIWPLAKEDQTDFGRFARAKALKSQAITPTTNIADIENLSANVFRYVTQTDKVKGISINIANIEDVFGANLLDMDGVAVDASGMPGTLRYVDNEFKVLTKRGALTVDQTQVQSFISQTINKALAPATDVFEMGQGASRRTAVYNKASLAINDLGISFGTAARADQIFGIGTSTVSKTFDNSQLIEAFGSVYRNYGSGLSVRDQTMASLGLGPRDSVFEVGLGNFAPSVPANVAAKFAAIGDPFYFLDAQSRSLSTMIAQSTARTGAMANKAASATLKTKEEVASIAFSSNPNLTAELGVSYFHAQDQMSAFRAASREFGTSKIVIPTELIKQTYEGFADDTIRGLQLSVVDSELLGTRVNLVWDVKRQMSRDKVKAMFETMFDVLSDEKRAEEIFGSTFAEMNSSIQSEINFARTATRNITEGATRPQAVIDAIEMATEIAMERGIVMGYMGGDQAEEIIANLRRMGFDISNDVNIRNFSADMLRTNLGKETIPVSPFLDAEAVEIAGRQDEIRYATELVDDPSGQKVSRVVQSYNEISEKIGSDKQLSRQIKKGIKYGKMDDGGRVLADFYTTHKPKLGLGLAVSAIAGVGYYQAKKKREKDLYEESINKMPYESVRKLDPMADIYSFPPARMNPLATAGVVGNLDRNKIGHHQMGTNKYDHLFG